MITEAGEKHLENGDQAEHFPQELPMPDRFHAQQQQTAERSYGQGDLPGLSRRMIQQIGCKKYCRTKLMDGPGGNRKVDHPVRAVGDDSYF